MSDNNTWDYLSDKVTWYYSSNKLVLMANGSEIAYYNEFPENFNLGNWATIQKLSVQNYTVTFDYNDNKTENTIVTVPSGNTVTSEKVNEVDDYTFDGWYEKDDDNISDETFDFTTPITRNIYLVAKYTVQVTYVEVGNITVVDDEIVIDNIPIDTEYETEVIDDDYYIFDGYYTSEDLDEEFEDGTVLEENIVLYYRWRTPMIKITYQEVGDVELEKDIVDEEIAKDTPIDVVELEDPTYTFDGYYLDEDLTIPYEGQKLSSDTTLYYSWKLDEDIDSNPNTIDNINMYMIMFISSFMLCITSLFIYKKIY
jgi:hypothetical protein